MALFANVKFFVASSIPQEKRRALSSCLKANGGVEVSLNEATHVITNSDVFDGKKSIGPEAFVVSVAWVDRSIILEKLQETKYYSPDPKMIFSGVFACSTDLESADKEVISAGIRALGGNFRDGLTKDVTHLLAPCTGSDKYEAALHFSKDLNIKIVLPHWFDDCYRCMLKLDEEPYMWPDPIVLKNPSANDPEPDKERRKIIYPDEKRAFLKNILDDKNVSSSPSKSPTAAQVFSDVWNGKRVLLSRSLGLERTRRETIEMAVKRGGGIVVPFNPDKDHDEEEEERRVTEADVLVTRYRFGRAYLKAVKDDKTVGSLKWLFHVQNTGVLVRPQDQLLHYPIRKKPIEGFSDHVITVTNYSGDPRDYIKRLVDLMGAKFTAAMTAQNTVVIAAYIGGSKTDKAREWSIPVVNHLWLEDCFSEWRNLTPALDKYINFPFGINFATLLAAKTVGKITYEDEVKIIELDSQEEGANETKVPEQHIQQVDNSKVPKDNGLYSKESPRKVVNQLSHGFSTPRPLGRTNSGEAMDVEEVDGLLTADHDMDVQLDYNSHMDEPGPSRRTTVSPQKNSSGLAPRKSGEEKHKDDSDSDDPVIIEIQEVQPTKKTPAARSGKAPLMDKVGPPSNVGTMTPNRRPKTLQFIPDLTDDEDDDITAPKSLLKNKRQPPNYKTPVIKSVTRRASANLADKQESEESEYPDEELPAAEFSKSPRPTGTSRKKTTKVASHTLITGPSRSVVTVEIPPQKSLGKLIDPTPAIAKPVTPARSPNRRIERTTTLESTPEESGNPSQEGSSRSGSREENHAQYLPINQRSPLRRSAATKATQQLREIIMPDLVSFEKEMKTGKIRNSWESSKGKGKENIVNGKKRRTSNIVAEEEEEEDTAVTRNRKKRRLDAPTKGKTAEYDNEAATADLPSLSDPEESETLHNVRHTGKKMNSNDTDDFKKSLRKVRLMTTSFTLELQPEKEEVLQKLGVEMTDDPNECTHLVTERISRTLKFLSVMSRGVYIVEPRWVFDSIAARRLMPESNYFVKDAEKEAEYNFKLYEAIERSKNAKKKLFEGHLFYLTPNLAMSNDHLRSIIMSAGGRVQILRTKPALRTFEGHLEEKHLVSSLADKAIWHTLGEKGVPIYDGESIIRGVLMQEMNWSDRKLTLK